MIPVRPRSRARPGSNNQDRKPPPASIALVLAHSSENRLATCAFTSQRTNAVQCRHAGSSLLMYALSARRCPGIHPRCRGKVVGCYRRHFPQHGNNGLCVRARGHAVEKRGTAPCCLVFLILASVQPKRAGGQGGSSQFAFWGGGAIQWLPLE